MDILKLLHSVYLCLIPKNGNLIKNVYKHWILQINTDVIWNIERIFLNSLMRTQEELYTRFHSRPSEIQDTERRTKSKIHTRRLPANKVHVISNRCYMLNDAPTAKEHVKIVKQNGGRRCRYIHSWHTDGDDKNYKHVWIGVERSKTIIGILLNIFFGVLPGEPYTQNKNHNK